ncbi:MAG: PAS domain S-box protein, partial [Desulfobacterales bacterium]|nr:PAS domain S-box protein [Desulfobacterales bacterium]
AEKEIQNLAKFPSENPNPVLRIARDGTLLYVNEAGLRQLAELHLQVGQAAPPMLREVVFQAMENGSTQVFDIEHRERVYSFFVGPVVDAGYANLYGRDITERKQAEEALRENEEKYHTLFEESRDAISITTREGKFIDINQAWLELLGYTKEELMSLNVQETYANPDDRSRLQQEIERKKFVRDYEIKLRKKDGTAIDSLLTFTVWRAYNGNILGYQGIIRDITEHKRAEDQILRQGAVLDGISKVFRQALICKTEEELSSKSLTVAEELTGSKFGWIGEINQEGRLDAIALSDPGWNECRMSKSDAVIMIKDMEIRGIWGEVLKDEQSLIVNDPLSHPDSVGTPEGHPPITVFLGVPLKQAGKTFGMIALANKESGYDLPDQEAVETLSVAIAEALKHKRAEEALRESEEKYRILVENANEAIIVAQDGMFKFINPKAMEITGYSKEELTSRPFVEFIHPDDREMVTERHLKRLRDESVSLVYPFRITDKNGNIRWVEINAVKIEWEGRAATLNFLSDTTERKWAEEALQAAKEIFEKTFVSQRDAIFLLDAINPPTILDCNPAATEVFGYTRQEMVGRTTDFLHVGETAQKEFQGQLSPTIAERGFMHLFEFQMRHKDGTVIPTEHSVTPLEDEQGERIGWVSVVRDITERKQS